MFFLAMVHPLVHPLVLPLTEDSPASSTAKNIKNINSINITHSAIILDRRLSICLLRPYLQVRLHSIN